MKQFFKFMFASMLGTFLLFFLVTLISFGIIAAIVATASSDETVISKNTVLRITLSKPVVDRSSKMKFTMGFAGPDKVMGLNDILDNLKKAKKDISRPRRNFHRHLNARRNPRCADRFQDFREIHLGIQRSIFSEIILSCLRRR